MVQTSSLTAEQRANLVAYLDGELGEEETLAIERMLATSETARGEVEALGRTWNLLDVLPQESASAEFATNTFAKLHGQAAPPADRRLWWNRGPLVFGWSAVLVSAGVIGFMAGQRWLPREDDAYVEQLPVLENLDDYRTAGNVEFLKQLERSDPPLDSRGDRR